VILTSVKSCDMVW